MADSTPGFLEVAVIVAGAVLAWFALVCPRPKRTETPGPWCRRCRYCLQGILPQATICPECGSALSAKNIRTPSRITRALKNRMVIVWTAGLILIAAGLYPFFPVHRTVATTVSFWRMQTMRRPPLDMAPLELQFRTIHHDWAVPWLGNTHPLPWSHHRRDDRLSIVYPERPHDSLVIIDSSGKAVMHCQGDAVPIKELSPPTLIRWWQREGVEIPGAQASAESQFIVNAVTALRKGDPLTLSPVDPFQTSTRSIGGRHAPGSRPGWHLPLLIAAMTALWLRGIWRIN